MRVLPHQVISIRYKKLVHDPDLQVPSWVPWPRSTSAQIRWIAHNIQLVSHGFSSTVTLAIGPGKELYLVRHLGAGGKETHPREGGQLRRRF